MEISILCMLLNVLEPELLRPRFEELYVFYLQKHIAPSLKWHWYECVYVFMTGDSRGSSKVRCSCLEEKKKGSRPCEGERSPHLQSATERQDWLRVQAIVGGCYDRRKTW